MSCKLKIVSKFVLVSGRRWLLWTWTTKLREMDGQEKDSWDIKFNREILWSIQASQLAPKLPNLSTAKVEIA